MSAVGKLSSVHRSSAREWEELSLRDCWHSLGHGGRGDRCSGLSYARFYLTVAGRRCTEDTEHWEEQKALRLRGAGKETK